MRAQIDPSLVILTDAVAIGGSNVVAAKFAISSD